MKHRLITSSCILIIFLSLTCKSATARGGHHSKAQNLEQCKDCNDNDCLKAVLNHHIIDKDRHEKIVSGAETTIVINKTHAEFETLVNQPGNDCSKVSYLGLNLKNELELCVDQPCLGVIGITDRKFETAFLTQLLRPNAETYVFTFAIFADHSELLITLRYADNTVKYFDLSHPPK